MPDLTKIAAASVTNPAALAVVASIAAGQLPAGQYQLKTVASVSGAAVGDLGNLRLRRGGVVLMEPIPCGAGGESEDFILDQVLLDGTQAVDIQAVILGTAEYNVQLTAVKVG